MECGTERKGVSWEERYRKGRNINRIWEMEFEAAGHRKWQRFAEKGVWKEGGREEKAGRGRERVGI